MQFIDSLHALFAEADIMHNCFADYCEVAMNGRYLLFRLRAKQYCVVSLVKIKKNEQWHLLEIKGKCNNKVSSESNQIVEKRVEDVNLSYGNKYFITM